MGARLEEKAVEKIKLDAKTFFKFANKTTTVTYKRSPDSTNPLLTRGARFGSRYVEVT